MIWQTPITAAAASADDLYREQVEALGAEELFETLPAETRELLRSLGITDLELQRYTALQPNAVMQTLLALFSKQVGGVGALCGVLLGVIVMAAFAETVRQTATSGTMGETVSRICAVAVCASVLVPVGVCLEKVGEAVESVRVLMLSFVPTYAAVILAGGHATLAASYSTVLLAAAECVTALVGGVALPLLTVSLGLGTAGALSHRNRLSGISGGLAKGSMWLLGTVTALFVGILSMQSFVATAADSLGQRAAKMTVSSFVPIVGGALSEAFSTLTGCISVLRSTLGMFGVLASAALVLPPFFYCFSWSLAIGLCRTAAEMLGVPSVGGVLGTVQTVVKVLMGMLGVCALLLIVTTTLVTVAGR
ncbi:MAG: hypothetical protein E7549_07865 [Ruminococcaceae bacterium]|nr:hypothetical protein [Oscillospiraceae bacterium]